MTKFTAGSGSGQLIAFPANGPVAFVPSVISSDSDDYLYVLGDSSTGVIKVAPNGDQSRFEFKKVTGNTTYNLTDLYVDANRKVYISTYGPDVYSYNDFSLLGSGNLDGSGVATLTPTTIDNLPHLIPRP
jgi:hypothetical protein